MLHVQGCRMGLPALVQPLAELCSDELSRYSRHVLLPELGLNGQRRLKTSRVLVIGAGGLGSPVLLYLAAAGVGTLGIVEFDVVEASNLQRQVIHGVSSVGCSKAESAQQAIAEINPYVRVCLHKERFEVSNALALLADYDLVVDGTDNFATRYLINDACVLARKPYVWGSVFRFEGQASVFWEHAPEGRGLNYRDVYPEPPPPELAPSCSEGGVLGVVCASIGSIMATEAVKLITGVGESLLGRLAVFDALDMTYRFMPLRPARHRKQIEQFEDYQALCGLNTLTKTLDVPMVTLDELQVWRSQGVGFQLIDVRERNEWDIVRMPDALHVQKDHLLKPVFLAQIKPETPLVLYCKSGARSAKAVALLQAQGFLNVHSLQGGVLAWVREVAPSLPTY